MKKTKAKIQQKLNDLTRLNKIIAESGLCSRRKADDLIKSGAVQVNGKIINDLGYKVNYSDKITVNGNPIKTNIKHTYILLNKPKNVLTTTDDEKNRKTVIDIIKTQSRIFPVGRLDRNTTGVLLLTNDGELTYRLTHPKYQVERIYSVKLDKELETKHAKNIALGLDLPNFKTNPCEIFINPKDKTKIIIKLIEGKNHEVKKMFESQGYFVKQLDRKIFAGLSYQGLKRGEYKHLNKKELLALKRLVKLD